MRSARTAGGWNRLDLLVACLCIAGAMLELACCWLCLISPELTAGYNSDFTRQFSQSFGIPPPGSDHSPVGELLFRLEIGLVAMVLAYIAALLLLARVVGESNLTKRLVIGFSLVFHVTFLAMPGLYSTDIYSYVMYGRIASIYGQNPYVVPPSSFGADPFLSWVFPFWQNTPTVYGPLWTDVSTLLSSATANASALDQVLAYKLLIWTSALVNLGLVWTLTKRAAWIRGPRLACFALYAWNPIVLFELAGNAHNDALMVTLLLLSILPLVPRRQHWPTAIFIVTASALIKFATAPVILFYAAAGLRRWRTAVLAFAAVFALTVLVSWPDPALPLTTSRSLVINSIPDLIAQLGLPVDAVRLLCVTLYAAVLMWDLVRVWRMRSANTALEASARALLLLPVLVLTWVWSWYFTWSIAVAAVLGIRTRLAQTIVAFSVVTPPVFYAHQYLSLDMPTWPLLVYVTIPLVVLLRGMRGRRLVSAREAVSG